MIGWLRLVLAYLVVASHFGGQFDPGAVGTFAVQGFFVASGFLMTAVLNGPYAGRPGAFWANRFFKLFPAYWLVCIATAALILCAPIAAEQFRHFWVLDADPLSIFANLTMVPFAFDIDGKYFHWFLITQAWSVAAEILNYAVVFFVTSRSYKAALFVLAVGVAYHVSCFVIDGAYWRPRYSLWYAGLVPFSVGALAWFMTRTRSLPVSWGLAAIVGWTANFVVANWVVHDLTIRDGWMWYANILLIAAIVASFAPRRGHHIANKIDAFVGDLAYPIFLAHLTVRFAVELWLGAAITFQLVMQTCVAVFLCAFVMSRLSAAIVEPLRDAIRVRSVR